MRLSVGNKNSTWNLLYKYLTGLIPRPSPLSLSTGSGRGLETRWGTHPSSPLKVMLSFFFCRCLISDFITCSYASSSRWLRRMLNFSRELWVRAIQYGNHLFLLADYTLAKAWLVYSNVFLYRLVWRGESLWCPTGMAIYSECTRSFSCVSQVSYEF